MTATLLLWAQAVLYAGFAVWSTVKADETMRSLGLSATTIGGRSEFMAVYGGIEAAFAVFFLLGACMPAHRRSAVLVGALVAGGALGWRACTLLGHGTAAWSTVLPVAGVEAVLLMWSLIALRAAPSR